MVPLLLTSPRRFFIRTTASRAFLEVPSPPTSSTSSGCKLNTAPPTASINLFFKFRLSISDLSFLYLGVEYTMAEAIHDLESDSIALSTNSFGETSLPRSKTFQPEDCKKCPVIFCPVNDSHLLYCQLQYSPVFCKNYHQYLFPAMIS